MDAKIFSQATYIATASGSLPLVVIAFMEYFSKYQLNSFAASYILVILCFISGFYWYEGLRLQAFRLILYSILLSLNPWLIWIYGYLNEFNSIYWCGMLLLVWFYLLIDYLLLAGKTGYRLLLIKLRWIGSISLSFGIILVWLM